MALTNRGGAKALRKQVINEKGSERGREVTTDILDHFNRIALLNERFDLPIEKMLMEDEITAQEAGTGHLNFERGLLTLSPSSADKCERELYYKGMREKQDEQIMFPYQRRWVRNGSAIHAATQRDLLYGERFLTDPMFSVHRTKLGKPAWEKNIRVVRQFEHQGVRFQIYGMMDGVLRYERDNSLLGFEFKTKSTTLGAIGDYKMKDAAEPHKLQCTAYSLLFNLNEFVLVYESLAKDGWMKNSEAKGDMRAFLFEPTQEAKTELLDKFAAVATQYYEKKLPRANTDKCIFCNYKSLCKKEENANVNC